MNGLSRNSIIRLRQVKAAILAQPHFYAQNRWVSSISKCGTTCCIAGWADFIFNGKKTHEARAKEWSVADEWVEVAADALDISFDEAEILCSGSTEWPEGLSADYAASYTDEERAQVAAARIEHFIKTGGAE